MPIRSYQTGDEHAQAGSTTRPPEFLPAFKPSTPEEIARRYKPADPDSTTRYYAIENGEVVGYAVFGSNGRVSYPWCLPGAEHPRASARNGPRRRCKSRDCPRPGPLIEATGSPVLDFLREHGFHRQADDDQLRRRGVATPRTDRLPSNRLIEPLKQEDLPQLIALEPGLFAGVNGQELRAILLEKSVLQFPGEPVRIEGRRKRQDPGRVPPRGRQPLRRSDQDRCRHALFSSGCVRHRARAAQASDWSILVRFRGSGRRGSDALRGAAISWPAELSTDPHRSPSSLRCRRALWLVRPLLRAAGVISHLVPSTLRADASRRIRRQSNVAAARSCHYDV